jgi:hypothetical protein
VQGNGMNSHRVFIRIFYSMLQPLEHHLNGVFFKGSIATGENSH